MAVDTTARAWRASRDSKGGVFITREKTLLVGGPQSFVAADKNGITMRGPVSQVSMSNENKFAGLFGGLGEFMEMVPSTLATPLPQRIPVPPISGIINVVQDLALFISSMT